MGDTKVTNISGSNFQIGKSKPFIVVAIIAVVALVAAATAFNSVQNVYDGTDVVQLQADFDNHKFAIDKELADVRKAMAILDADHHGKFNMISDNFTSIATTLQTHSTGLNILRTAAQIVVPPSVGGTANFNLQTINIQTFQEVTEFPQDMPVYITGNYDGSESVINYEIRKNGQFVKSGSGSITANTFTFAYNIDNAAELGTYVVTVKIGLSTDKVTFEIT